MGGVAKELLDIQMRSLSLQQFQQTGGIFISQSKNLVVTVIAAVSVIEGDDFGYAACRAIHYRAVEHPD